MYPVRPSLFLLPLSPSSLWRIRLQAVRAQGLPTMIPTTCLVARQDLGLSRLLASSATSPSKPSETKAGVTVNSWPAHSGQEARNREKEEERETKQFKQAIRH
ncbi:hypothetical protein HOY80DRAFT_1002135 [Tuber brumale]|nr:hypothetical protein HOY80DRAFT_1002135 [Tuber brumale]